MTTAPAGSLATAVADLQDALGDRLSTTEAIREHHAASETLQPSIAPDAVAFPASSAEVARIVTTCRLHGVPLIPYGAGTSLEGQTVAVRGGIAMDMSRMNRILAVRPDDMDCTIEAGVTRQQLQVHLAREGLFFPVDPGADATLGGMASTRASGTTSVRYGTMRELVTNLTVVLPDGTEVTTARRARKSAAGYDLTHLFVGAEGTLGVITELTIRVFGIPDRIAAATVSFDTLDGAVSAVISMLQLGVDVARIELLDDVQVESVNRFSGLGLPPRPTLFLEFHGFESAVTESAEIARSIASDFGGGQFEWTSDQAERTRLWRARHDAAYANKALRPGASLIATDVCVPLSALAACISDTKSDLLECGLVGPIVGHVGDGNFHVGLVVDPTDHEELGRAHQFCNRLVERALAADGTCTGEHGIGLGKQSYLVDELGDRAVELMREIRRALDPGDIMNPGKITGSMS